MQIGAGSSPLSLAVLKTLGVQAPGAAGPAAPAAAAGRSAVEGAEKAVPGGRDPGVEKLGVEKTVPRGSFVDLKM